MRNIGKNCAQWHIKVLKHTIIFEGNGYGAGALVQHKDNSSAGVGIVIKPTGMRVGEIYGDWNLVEYEYQIAGWDTGLFPITIKDSFGAITDLKLIKSVNTELNLCYNGSTTERVLYL